MAAIRAHALTKPLRVGLSPRAKPPKPLQALPSHQYRIRKHDADGDGLLTALEVSALLTELELEAKSAAVPARPAAWDTQIKSGLQHVQAKGLASMLSSLLHAKVVKPVCHSVPSDVIWSALGMFLAVLSLGCLNTLVKQLPGVGAWHQKGLNLLLGSFGTICVLLFARPEAEAIRAWNLIMGHVVSVTIVVLVMAVMGPGIMSRALAMALALAGMLLTDSVHPPGGALILLAEDSMAIQSMSGWFLLYPSLTWTIAILLPLGAMVNWLKREVRFGWTGQPISKQVGQQGTESAKAQAEPAGPEAGRVAVAGADRTSGKGLYAAWFGPKDGGEPHDFKLA